MKETKNNSDFLENCTILLQGRIDKECIDLWIQNYKNSKVVLSVWEDENLAGFKFPQNWKLLVNQYPLTRFKPKANLDYQIITTTKGLYKVETEWVIKMRCDEYWSNVETIYSKMKSNPFKIVTGSMFFRNWELYQFHCSDKILAGKTENLLSTFESVLENIKNDVWDSDIPECQIGLAWIMVNEPNIDLKGLYPTQKKDLDFKNSVNGIINGSDIVIKNLQKLLTIELNPHRFNYIKWEAIRENLIRSKDILVVCAELAEQTKEIKPINHKYYMRKWFDIINIDELKPYIATRNNGSERIWFRSDFDHNKNYCLTDINHD